MGAAAGRINRVSKGVDPKCIVVPGRAGGRCKGPIDEIHPLPGLQLCKRRRQVLYRAVGKPEAAIEGRRSEKDQCRLARLPGICGVGGG